MGKITTGSSIFVMGNVPFKPPENQVIPAFSHPRPQNIEEILNREGQAMVRFELRSVEIVVPQATSLKIQIKNAAGGQTPLAMALFAGLVDEESEAGVLKSLLKAIADKDGHIDAGVLGTKALINVLMRHGHTDVLYTMANKRTFPGWGYWIDELGANTLFQNWDGSQSRNHIMFGSIGDFFHKWGYSDT